MYGKKIWKFLIFQSIDCTSIQFEVETHEMIDSSVCLFFILRHILQASQGCSLYWSSRLTIDFFFLLLINRYPLLVQIFAERALTAKDTWRKSTAGIIECLLLVLFLLLRAAATSSKVYLMPLNIVMLKVARIHSSIKWSRSRNSSSLQIKALDVRPTK